MFDHSSKVKIPLLKNLFIFGKKIYSSKHLIEGGGGGGGGKKWFLETPVWKWIRVSRCFPTVYDRENDTYQEFEHFGEELLAFYRNQEEQEEDRRQKEQEIR